MTPRKRTAISLIFIGLGVVASFGPTGAGDKGFFPTGRVDAQEDWRNEFDDVCSKTQDAMIFTSDELKDLAARCDRLKPILEKLDEPQRKVYLKRLRSCRDLYLFVLESRKKGQ